jgi:Domain of unknown function (DUF4397)
VNRLLKLLLPSTGLVSLAVILLSLGCGGSGGTKFRVMNAVVDEQSVDVLLDNAKVATQAYGVAPTYISISGGSRHLQIEPTGSSTPFIDQTLSISSGNNYTVVAANFSSDHDALVLIDQNSTPASGDIAIRVVNVSPSMGAADVYIVSPTTDINTVNATISNLAFGGVSTYQVFSAGSYVVIFTTPANGGKFQQVNSGTLSLVAGQVRTIVALNGQEGGFTDAVLADLN